MEEVETIQMKKLFTVILLSLWVLSTVLYIPLAVGGDPVLDVDLPVESKPKISFQPNVIPFLNVTSCVGRNNESFRFEWLNNTFDIEIFFNATFRPNQLYSLNDFLDDIRTDRNCPNATVEFQSIRNESFVQFGLLLDGIENVSDYVHNAWFKIEDSSFDYNATILEEIEVFVNETTGEPLEQPYNITRFHLPDNLVLSFEDLYHKGFIIGSQNKTMTSVKGFSGKSSWNLDPITYSGDIITVVGYTSGSRATFEDIYTEIANASIFEKHSNTQYSSSARLVIGDGTNATWFRDSLKMVMFNASAITANVQSVIQVKNNANFDLGYLISASEKTSREGCDIGTEYTQTSIRVILADSGANVKVYNSHLFHTVTLKSSDLRCSSGGNFVLWHSILTRIDIADQGDWDVYDVYIRNPRYGIVDINDPDVDSVTVQGAWGGSIYSSYAYDMNFSNVKLYDGTYNFYMVRISTGKYVVNTEADVWSFFFYLSSGEVFRQYSFDLTVTTASNVPIEDANVTLSYYGEGGGTHGTWLTDANGEIPEQTVTAGFYNQTGGNTIYTYNPYEITITKAGYLTYQRNFTQIEAKSWNIALLTEINGAPWSLALLAIIGLVCIPLVAIIWKVKS